MMGINITHLLFQETLFEIPCGQLSCRYSHLCNKHTYLLPGADTLTDVLDFMGKLRRYPNRIQLDD